MQISAMHTANAFRATPIRVSILNKNRGRLAKQRSKDFKEKDEEPNVLSNLASSSVEEERKIPYTPAGTKKVASKDRNAMRDAPKIPEYNARNLPQNQKLKRASTVHHKAS